MPRKQLSVFASLLPFALSGCGVVLHNAAEHRAAGASTPANSFSSAAQRSRGVEWTELRVVQKLSSEREVGFSLGIWPASSMIDLSGFSSYAALVEFAEPAAKRMLEIFATESYQQRFNASTGHTEKEIVVPVVTFLDEKRQAIATENPTQAGFVPHHVRYVIRVPEAAAFFVVHTSAERLASDIPGSPAATTSFAPIGAGGVVVRGSGVQRYVPARTGGIRLKLQ